jgi:hypothetical protein
MDNEAQKPELKKKLKKLKKTKRNKIYAQTHKSREQ